MGNENTEPTQASILSAEAFIDNIVALGDVSSKKMFGGYGLFHDGKMFGLLDSKGRYFLKVDDGNRAEYEAENCVQHSRMPYFSLPDDVLSNKDLLISWAEKSIAASK